MIEYFNEDCMIGMARHPDKYFDLAIVDPPYGIGENGSKSESRCRKTGKWTTPKKKVYSKKFDDSKPMDDFYFRELLRVSKNQIIWGANHFISRIPKDSPCWIVWDKKNGNNDFADCELAWSSFNTSVRKFEWLWNGFQKQQPESRFHPTQKPVALYKWLLTNYAKQGDLILDTHVGSASSLIACHDMGFDAVGFELDPDYYAKSKQRLEDFMRQPRIDAIEQQQLEQLML